MNKKSCPPAEVSKCVPFRFPAQGFHSVQKKGQKSNDKLDNTASQPGSVTVSIHGEGSGIWRRKVILSKMVEQLDGSRADLEGWELCDNRTSGTAIFRHRK